MSFDPSAARGSRDTVGDDQIRVGPVDATILLERLSGLPIWAWRYRWEDPPTEHVGPFPEDFMAAFHLDEDDRLINPQDAIGVLLASVQGLHQQVRALSERVSGLEARIAAGLTEPPMTGLPPIEGGSADPLV